MEIQLLAASTGELSCMVKADITIRVGTSSEQHKTLTLMTALISVSTAKVAQMPSLHNGKLAAGILDALYGNFGNAGTTSNACTSPAG
jgi:hypothetical protein